MVLPRCLLLRWIPLAGVVSAGCLLLYAVGQQLWRQDANDPQVQLARDAAVRLGAGEAPAVAVSSVASTDFAESLAPFLTALRADGTILASSGRLGGALRTVPTGVLEAARRSGEARVTWQPEPGVRIASVVVHYANGFVVAGRSLAESERRTAQLGALILVGWVGTLLGLAVLVTATELALDRAR